MPGTINPLNEQVLEDFRTDFRDGIEALDNMRADAANNGVLNRIARIDPTTTDITVEGYGDSFPKMKKVFGPRELEAVRLFKQTFESEKYSAALPIPEKLIVHDARGRVANLMSNFFRIAARDFLLEMVIEHLLDADNGEGFDGQPIYSTTHPYGPNGTTQSNDTPGSEWTIDVHRTIMEAGEALQTEKGKPYHVQYDTVLCGTDYKRTGMEILEVEQRPIALDSSGAINPGASGVGAATIRNVSEGECVLISHPLLTGTDQIFYIDWASGWLPVIVKLSQAPTERIDADFNTGNLFDKGEAIFAIDSWAGPGWGPWQGTHRLDLS